MKKKNINEIFKIQRALNNDNVLVYNEDRSIMGQFQIDKSLKKLFGSRYKIYVVAKYNNDTTKIDIKCKITDKDTLAKIDW